MKIENNKGIQRMIKQLHDLQDLPNDRMQEDLDRAIASASATAASHTHIMTGALKGSMQFSSEKEEEGGWSGEISWNTYYGPFEFARDGHDPRAHLEPHAQDIEDIINRGPKYL